MAYVQFNGFPKGHPYEGGAGSWPGAGSFEPGEVKQVTDELAAEMLSGDHTGFVKATKKDNPDVVAGESTAAVTPVDPPAKRESK